MSTEACHQQAQHLLDELEGGWLEVAKVPNQNGGYIRVAVSTNAEWYRRFCGRHLGSRKRYPKLRTFIKRCHTVAALKRIIQGEREGCYVERLLEVMANGRVQ